MGSGDRKRAEPFIGNEKRTSILPTGDTDLKYKEPRYDYSAAIPLPGDIGVKQGDSLDSVFGAVKGMAFYTDVIGFGGSSSSMTSGMPLNPLGINYFAPTYQTCPNGAQMWTYIQGIPQGNALGKTVQRAFEKQGFPALKGLAPGALEDTQAALNPMPYINAVIGDPYADCEQVTLPVGDANGKTIDPNDGNNVWIQSYEIKDGRPVQTHWIQKKDAKGNLVFVDRKKALCTPKEFNKDGSRNTNPPVLDKSCSQGFTGSMDIFSTQDTLSLVLAAGFLCLAVYMKHGR
jgi:hypothetical protein